MVALIIFYLHILGFVTGFTKEYQHEGLSGGFLTLGFMVLIFSVGWSISTFLVRQALAPAGFGPWLDRDAVSLLLLTAAEAVFYFYYFRESR